MRRLQRILSSEEGAFGGSQSGPTSRQLAIERGQRFSWLDWRAYTGLQRSQRRAVDPVLCPLQDRDMRSLSSGSSRGSSPRRAAVGRRLQSSEGESCSAQNYHLCLNYHLSRLLFTLSIFLTVYGTRTCASERKFNIISAIQRRKDLYPVCPRAIFEHGLFMLSIRGRVCVRLSRNSTISRLFSFRARVDERGIYSRP